ncbi:uncharacterized protein LOC131255240 [Magnolia sinica]|uniref:uncharacterized protein LOC131255240 n=1 Tax=Magnolia sinica TaxID=86752 RepID=UPI00265A87BB|nr:uncharacterized protein LOC131255240 [Magnolia sinica]
MACLILHLHCVSVSVSVSLSQSPSLSIFRSQPSLSPFLSLSLPLSISLLFCVTGVEPLAQVVNAPAAADQGQAATPAVVIALGLVVICLQLPGRRIVAVEFCNGINDLNNVIFLEVRGSSAKPCMKIQFRVSSFAILLLEKGTQGGKLIFSFDATKKARFVLPRYAKDELQIRWYNYKLGHRLFNGSYIWSQTYHFHASPYPGQDSLQCVVIFRDMGKVGSALFLWV